MQADPGDKPKEACFRLAPLTTGAAVNVHLALTPLIALIAGILILVMPRLLNFIVAIYLILIGVVGIFGPGMGHLA